MQILRQVPRIALAVLLARASMAQQVDSFSRLPLWINRDDRVRVVDQTGAKVVGRLTTLNRDGLTLHTDVGDRAFTSGTVRRLDVSGQSKARGALVGAATMLVVGLAACPSDSAAGCPMFAALFWGAPMGTLIGAWVPHMSPVYQASSAGSMRTSSGQDGPPSLLEVMGLHVNLNDNIQVTLSDGKKTSGRLTSLDDNTFSIADRTNTDVLFRRDDVRQVTIRRSPVRRSVLIGFLAGSVVFVPGSGSEWVDAVVLGGGLGAGVGAIVGALIHTTTVAYPAATVPGKVVAATEPGKVVAAAITTPTVAPMVRREGVGLRVSFQF